MKSILFLQNIGIWEILILALVVLLVFGGKKIPELMRGLGRGVREFKDGVKGIEDDINADPEPARKQSSEPARKQSTDQSVKQTSDQAGQQQTPDDQAGKPEA